MFLADTGLSSCHSRKAAPDISSKKPKKKEPPPPPDDDGAAEADQEGEEGEEEEDREGDEVVVSDSDGGEDVGDEQQKHGSSSTKHRSTAQASDKRKVGSASLNGSSDKVRCTECLEWKAEDSLRGHVASR